MLKPNREINFATEMLVLSKKYKVGDFYVPDQTSLLRLKTFEKMNIMTEDDGLYRLEVKNLTIKKWEKINDSTD